MDVLGTAQIWKPPIYLLEEMFQYGHTGLGHTLTLHTRNTNNTQRCMHVNLHQQKITQSDAHIV